MDYVGLDVHKSKTQICIDEGGEEPVELRVETHPGSFRRIFGERERCRILLEAATESEWVARCLESLGHEVIVADPNFAPMYATRNRRVKTDRRDARALCDASRLGAYRSAHRSSDVSRELRAQVAVREALVTSRTKFIAVVRATLRAQGFRVPSGGAPTFVRRVHAMELPRELQQTVQPLLTSLEQLNEQIEQCNKSLETQAKDHPVVRRLMTVPNVGVLTALMFWAVVDDVNRFTTANKSVAIWV
jgi:transposase